MNFFSTIVVLLFISWSTSLMAFSLKGPIVELKNKKYVQWENSLYRIYSPHFGVASGIKRLKSGDHLAFTGEFTDNNNAIKINSIRYVGLASLLGVWRSEDWNIFEFRNFTSLNLYFAQPETFKVSSPSQLSFSFKPVDYSLSPHEDRDTWTMLMVDNSAVEVARLTFSDFNLVTIEVLDSTSGSVNQTITLYPMYGNLTDRAL